jgi:hypothetical protein
VGTGKDGTFKRCERIGGIRGDDVDVGEVAFVAAGDVETRALERMRHYKQNIILFFAIFLNTHLRGSEL